MMRVCLLLSGLIRSNNSFATINQHILTIYKPDVYCHVWYQEQHQKRDIELLLTQQYDPKVIRFEQHLNYNNSIESAYPELLQIHRHRGHPHDYSQLLGIKMVSELIDWSQYDFIIKARYDHFKIHNFPDLRSLSTDKFYASGHDWSTIYSPEMFRDFCFIMPNNFHFYTKGFDYIREPDFCNRMYAWQIQHHLKYTKDEYHAFYFCPELCFSYMFEEFNKWNSFVKMQPSEFMLNYLQ